MNQNYSKKYMYISLAIGIIELITGCLFALVNIISLILAITYKWVEHLYFSTVFLILFGAVLIILGSKRVLLAKTFRRLVLIMNGRKTVSLKELAFALSMAVDNLIVSIEKMMARRFLQNVYIDRVAGQFMLVYSGFIPPSSSAQNFSTMEEVKTKSIIPIYLIGFCWLIYAMLLPLYALSHFIVAAIISVVVYIVSSLIIPDKVTFVPKKQKPEPPPAPIDTGNSELDEILTIAYASMKELNTLNRSIANTKINDCVNELLGISKQIFEYIKTNPTQARQIRQFMNYYLPTTIKLLKTYDEFNKQRVKGQNITEAMAKIEEMLVQIIGVTRGQLDDLYSDKAVDISLDIEVMQQIIEQEGFNDDMNIKNFNKKK